MTFENHSFEAFEADSAAAYTALIQVLGRKNISATQATEHLEEIAQALKLDHGFEDISVSDTTLLIERAIYAQKDAAFNAREEKQEVLRIYIANPSGLERSAQADADIFLDRVKGAITSKNLEAENERARQALASAQVDQAVIRGMEAGY